MQHDGSQAQAQGRHLLEIKGLKGRGVLGADVKFEGDTRGVERDSEGKLGDLGVYWGADEGFRGDTGGEEEILGVGARFFLAGV